MFKFFTDKKWHLWSIGGTILILAATWYQVQLDVKINEWFGEFYDTLQKALTTPGSVSEKEFIAYLFSFAKVAGGWVIIAVFTGFLVSHWVFRWRTSMADYYHEQWKNARMTEGAHLRSSAYSRGLILCGSTDGRGRYTSCVISFGKAESICCITSV